jgi:cytochrome c
MTRAVTVFAIAVLAASCKSETAPPAGDAAAVQRVEYPNFNLGRQPTAAEIAMVDIDIDAKGTGLPAGSGSAQTGAAVYAAKCALCHGANAEGLGTFPKLVGRDAANFEFGTDVKLVKTVGNYWPYATTLFDYIRRAMPFTAPGSLTNDEVYGLVAFLLAKNEIVAETAMMDARTLPAVEMPARKRFVPDNRKGGSEFR